MSSALNKRAKRNRPWTLIPGAWPFATWGLLVLLVSPALLTSCGYKLAGRGGAIPGEVRSIHIGAFENRTREIDLDEKLVFALERELYRRGIIALEETQGAGDAEIRGSIRKFRSRPVAFDVDDEALQYEVELTVDAILERTDDGEVLWRGAGIYAVDAYSVSTDTVVPSSSEFQRGLVEFGALDDLTQIQLAETERRLAIERMVESAVRDIYERMIDDF